MPERVFLSMPKEHFLLSFAARHTSMPKVFDFLAELGRWCASRPPSWLIRWTLFPRNLITNDWVNAIVRRSQSNAWMFFLKPLTLP
jgi:hypothetical protein